MLHQLPVLGSTLRLLSARGDAPLPTPGPWRQDLVPGRPRALVRDAIRFAGGQPGGWGDELPPWFFPQWTWPLLTECLQGLPYDLTRVVNAGCTWERRGELKVGEPLRLSGRLLDIDADERRALVTLELLSGSGAQEDALRSTVTMFVPLSTGTSEGKKAAKPTVPLTARPLRERRLGADAGLDFALLTGDFNPIHWIPAYGRMAGFQGTILHGFAQAAIASEALIAGRFMNDTTRLCSFSCRFTRPLRLPGRARVFAHGQQVFVGSRPGGPAFMTGHFNLEESPCPTVS